MARRWGCVTPRPAGGWRRPGRWQPAAALDGDTTADVVIVGGGYLGMWTAWQLTQLAPGADVVVLEALLCGHGPSGRNGGFCETLWGDLPTLRERAGDERALAVCGASEDAVRGIDSCVSSTASTPGTCPRRCCASPTTESQPRSWDSLVRACAEVGAPEEVVALSADEVRRRCDSPLFLGGALYRTNATVHPARLALGLGARLQDAGAHLRAHPRAQAVA